MRKSPTGIAGLDTVTGGGLPTGRTTLVEGGAGSGKTVLALQTLVHGASVLDEPAIFVAFEENARRIVENARDFGWGLEELAGDRLFFIDAQPSPDLVRAGSFDLAGLLAAVGARVKAMGARRIAFDAIDVVLALLDSTAEIRREAFRLHDWLIAQELTALVTAKVGDNGAAGPSLGFMEFMVDCSIRLDHAVDGDVSQRSLRVRKYRGTAFEENRVPLVIGAGGIAVAHVRMAGHPDVRASTERLTTGVEQLDDMLRGGLFRGSSVLLTGAPGTAKTTLCGAFAQACCERGETVLFVSFDSRADEIVRNLESVGIRLADHIAAGRLHILALRALDGSAESHRAKARAIGARCLVADPLSALSKAGNRATGPGVAERLIDWSKAEGVTVVCTSLIDEQPAPAEATPLQISTLADTWIHLSYVVTAGERNRALSIVKSRGTGHSNQVRELVLDDTGVTLAEVYSAGGEVLMGTMRWARERDAELARRAHAAETEKARLRLEAEAMEMEARISLLRGQLDAKRGEAAALGERSVAERAERDVTRQGLHDMRIGSDQR